MAASTGILGPAEIEIKASGQVARLETEGDARLVSQDITIQPGGHTGWHSHPGPVFVTIAAGTLTLFDAAEPCSRLVYASGTSFVDPGGGHVHIARNLGDTAVSLKVLYMVPAGVPIRIDAIRPRRCRRTKPAESDLIAARGNGGLTA